MLSNPQAGVGCLAARALHPTQKRGSCGEPVTEREGDGLSIITVEDTAKEPASQIGSRPGYDDGSKTSRGHHILIQVLNHRRMPQRPRAILCPYSQELPVPRRHSASSMPSPLLPLTQG